MASLGVGAEHALANRPRSCAHLDGGRSGLVSRALELGVRTGARALLLVEQGKPDAERRSYAPAVVPAVGCDANAELGQPRPHAREADSTCRGFGVRLQRCNTKTARDRVAL